MMYILDKENFSVTQNHIAERSSYKSVVFALFVAGIIEIRFNDYFEQQVLNETTVCAEFEAECTRVT